MMSGGDLGNLKDGELDAWMIQHLLQFGIIPQLWHNDYKSTTDKLTETHKLDIIRMKTWRASQKQ